LNQQELLASMGIIDNATVKASCKGAN